MQVRQAQIAYGPCQTLDVTSRVYAVGHAIADSYRFSCQLHKRTKVTHHLNDASQTCLCAACTKGEDGITYAEHVNVSLAVTMPDGGLITPVIKVSNALVHSAARRLQSRPLLLTSTRHCIRVTPAQAMPILCKQCITSWQPQGCCLWWYTSCLHQNCLN